MGWRGKPISNQSHNTCILYLSPELLPPIIVSYRKKLWELDRTIYNQFIVYVDVSVKYVLPKEKYIDRSTQFLLWGILKNATVVHTRA